MLLLIHDVAIFVVSFNLFDPVPSRPITRTTNDEQHMYYQIPIYNDESNGSIT